MRYCAGAVVLDEAFTASRLCTRYWSAAGQVVPETHAGTIAWQADEPADSFGLAIDGRSLAGGYQWVSASTEPDPSAQGPDRQVPVKASIRLSHPASGVEVTVNTRLDGSPFLVRWLSVANHSARPIGVSAVAPFAGMIWTRRIDEHLPPGVSGPFQLAYTHRFQWGQEGDFWFEPLAPGVTTVNGGKLGRSGWGRPAFWARDIAIGQTLVCELAWGGNYEFALDCRLLDSPSRARLFFRMGLCGQDEALRVLLPGETVRTPAVHVGLFQADVDRIVQETHDHVRSAVLPVPIPGRHVEIEANHRGYLCDRENEPDLKRDEEVAKAVGAELYVVDAGWYGNDPNEWWNNAGDWRAGSWLPNGLEPIADHAHELGMRFGLWVEIEAAGRNSSLRREHAEWLLCRDGTPVNGRALDFTNPQVVRWAESEVERIIRQYRLDLFRIDHNHTLTPSGNRRFHGYTEDLTWRYYENLYGMIDRLRSRFPEVVFQNCAGGGGRLDWGTLSRFHNTELSDWMRMPRGLRILNGVTVSLPPEILLRTFGTEVGEHDLDGDLETQLRLVSLCRPILRGIAPSLDELTPALKARIDHALELFRRVIRPILVESRVFHHTPFLPIYGPSPWCVLEYASRDGEHAVAGLFRTSGEGPEEFLLKPRGLRMDGVYRVTFDSLSADTATATQGSVTMSGMELARWGLPVRLPNVMSSELVLFARTEPGAVNQEDA